MIRLVLPLAFAVAAGSALADCDPAPAPVASLDFESRYADGDETRSEIDPEAADEAEDALRPVDDFLRDLTDQANAVLSGEADVGEADCVVARMAEWARADALADLGSETANLTVGSRLAGFALVLLQVRSQATRPDDLATVGDWLSRRLRDQMTFWEEGAPPGARRGNLRAWAALAAAASAAALDDSYLRAWAAASTGYLLCTASPDGSLPQEMSRGPRALQYQLHAIAPLVVSVLLLDRQGVPLADLCDRALHRIVGFALDDLATGQRTQAITGEVQTLIDGSDTLEGFHLAWLEAYLRLGGSPVQAQAEALADQWRPLDYSKLGGDQGLLWGTP